MSALNSLPIPIAQAAAAHLLTNETIRPWAGRAYDRRALARKITSFLTGREYYCGLLSGWADGLKRNITTDGTVSVPKYAGLGHRSEKNLRACGYRLLDLPEDPQEPIKITGAYGCPRKGLEWYSQRNPGAINEALFVPLDKLCRPVDFETTELHGNGEPNLTVARYPLLEAYVIYVPHRVISNAFFLL